MTKEESNKNDLITWWKNLSIEEQIRLLSVEYPNYSNKNGMMRYALSYHHSKYPERLFEIATAELKQRKMGNKTHTRGNVIVKDINIGDIHYEYDLGLVIKCKVISKPILDDTNNMWSWESIDTENNEVIEYMVNKKYTQYAPNLYNYEAH